jgi:thiamine-phosphate pyrophosphorylase
MNHAYLKLCLVTNQLTHSFDSYEKLIVSALMGGVTAIQLRDKHRSIDELSIIAFRLKKLTKKFNIPLIINDHIHLAKKVNAEGVHLGQTDFSHDEARALLGPHKIIGLSLEKLADIKFSNQSKSINYVAASAIFPSKNKPDCKTLWGISGLRMISQQSLHPVIAIGGIDHKNIRAIMRAGAKGVAVIGALHDALNPKAAALALLSKIDKAP